MQRFQRIVLTLAIGISGLPYACLGAEPQPVALQQATPVAEAVELSPITSESDSRVLFRLDTSAFDIRSQLQTLPGLALRSSGGLGAYSEASLRGGSGRQSRISLNGFSLLTAGGEALNLALLPTSAIQFAQVDTQNNQGLTGDLQLLSGVSKAANDGQHHSVAGGIGSFGEAQLHSSFGIASLGAQLFLQARHADNDFPLRNRLKPFDPNDPNRRNEEARRNAATQNLSLLWLQPTQLFLLSSNREQIPNPRNSKNNQAELETILVQTGTHLVGGKRLRLGYLNEHFRDQSAQLAQLATDTRNQTYSIALSQEVGAWSWEGEVSAFAASDHQRPDADLDAQRAQVQANRFWSFANSGMQLGSLLLWENASPAQHSKPWELAPQFDAWHQWFFGPHSSRVQLQYRERIPTFFERYGNRGLFQGNPELNPEQAITLSNHWRLLANKFGTPINLELFQRWLWDGITPQYNARGTGRSTNAARAEVIGISLYSQWLAGPKWQVRSRIDWQKTTDTSGGSVQGKQLPGRPIWIADAQIQYQHRQWRLGYSFHFEDGAYYDSPNLLEAPTVRDHTLFASAPLLPVLIPRTRWRTEACNLSDNRHARFNGFPEPGRHFRLSLETTF